MLRGLEDSVTTALGAHGKRELPNSGRSSAWEQMMSVLQGEGVLWKVGDLLLVTPEVKSESRGIDGEG